MKKETKTEVKSKVMNGASTAVGATIGVVAGNVAAEANAAETPHAPGAAGHSATVSPGGGNDHVDDPNPGQPNPGQPNPGQPNPEQPTPGEPNPDDPNPVEPIPVDPDEPEVIVTDYGTVTNDDGSQMDVAVVSVDGQETFLVDVDQDGTADVLFADVNDDGVIDDNEILDIEGEGIYMASFQNEAMETTHTLVADNDYINDANVDDYMA